MRNNENGRSMVEMLGVLAIIGVLSVGGIAGYTTAMRSHKANEIVNAASILYMMGISRNGGAGGSEVTYSNPPEGVTTMKFTTGNKVSLEGISDADLCGQVKDKFGDKADTCTAATAPATGYTLTVTLGDVRTPETPNYGDDLTSCSQAIPSINKCCDDVGWEDCRIAIGGTPETEKCGGDTCEINGICYEVEH